MTDEELLERYDERYGLGLLGIGSLVIKRRRDLLENGILVDVEELGINKATGDRCPIFELKEYEE